MTLSGKTENKSLSDQTLILGATPPRVKIGSVKISKRVIRATRHTKWPTWVAMESRTNDGFPKAEILSDILLNTRIRIRNRRVIITCSRHPRRPLPLCTYTVRVVISSKETRSIQDSRHSHRHRQNIDPTAQSRPLEKEAHFKHKLLYWSSRLAVEAPAARPTGKCLPNEA